jgi:hypothetical protein
MGYYFEIRGWMVGRLDGFMSGQKREDSEIKHKIYNII